MADIAKILTEVQLEAAKAISNWQQFGKAGIQELRAIGKAANEANAQINNIGKGGGFKQAIAGLRSFGDEARKLGQTLSIGISVPLGLLGRSAVNAFREQEAALAQLDAALESTGGKVGVPRDELVGFAEEVQKQFAFADEEVIKMQTTLLKFGSITGDQFREAQQVIIDFAQRTGQDLSSAAQSVGRALEDPARGMNLLRRQGVILEKSQEDLIKTLAATGQTAKAQGLLLDALTQKVGGAAAAFAKTDAGKFQIAMNQLDDSLEKIGGIIAPVITQIAQFVSLLANAFVQLPQPIQNAVVYIGMFLFALGPIAFVVGSIIEAMLALTVFLTGPVGAAIIGVIAGIALLSTAFGGFQNLMINVLLGIAQVVQGLSELYDMFRFVANGFSSEGLVPSDWGVPIAKAALEMKKVAEESAKAAAEADKATGKVDGLAGAYSDAAATGKKTLSVLDNISKADTSGVTSSINQSNEASKSWLDTLKDIWTWLTKVDKKEAQTGGQGKAGGGLMMGPGTSTSDSIPAWLSRFEFVQRAAAVRKYGVRFMNMVNSLRFPVQLARGFAGGGLVGASSMLPAGGVPGMNGNEAGRSFTLVIDGNTFDGLTAPADTADAMLKFARQRKVKSTGKAPHWYR